MGIEQQIMAAAFHDELEKLSGVKRTLRLLKALQTGRVKTTGGRSVEQLQKAFTRGVEDAGKRGHSPTLTRSTRRQADLAEEAGGRVRRDSSGGQVGVAALPWGVTRKPGRVVELQQVATRSTHDLPQITRDLRLAHLRRTKVKKGKKGVHVLPATSPTPPRGGGSKTRLDRTVNPRYYAEA